MKTSNINFFKILSIATGALFAYLFYLLLLGSEAFLTDLGLESSTSTLFLAKRASILMLGCSVLLFGSINLQHSKARQIICTTIGVVMLGLACMGSYELNKGNINSSIIPAIVIELVIGLSFLSIVFINRKTRITSD